MRSACSILLVFFLSSCGSRRDPPDTIVRDYIRLAVALGERDRDSLDYYSGPPEWVSDIRAKPPSFREIKNSAISLASRLRELSGKNQRSPRVEFLIRQLLAIAARVNLLTGARLSFDEESEAFFGIRAPNPLNDPVNRERFTAIRVELGQLLPGPGSLAGRYAAFDQMFLIPPERLPAVLNRAMAGCRARSLKHFSLPPGEDVTVEYVSDKPWDGYSYYQGHFRSLIQINADFPLTVGRALDLACHEGYPGHHLYNSLQDAVLVQRAGQTELMVQPVFSPQSFVSESAATIAPEIAFPESERLAFERDELFPISNIDKSLAERYVRVEHLVAELDGAEVSIARDYLDGNLEFLRAEAALEEQTLDGSWRR